MTALSIELVLIRVKSEQLTTARWCHPSPSSLFCPAGRGFGVNAPRSWKVKQSAANVGPSERIQLVFFYREIIKANRCIIANSRGRTPQQMHRGRHKSRQCDPALHIDVFLPPSVDQAERAKHQEFLRLTPATSPNYSQYSYLDSSGLLMLVIISFLLIRLDFELIGPTWLQSSIFTLKRSLLFQPAVSNLFLIGGWHEVPHVKLFTKSAPPWHRLAAVHEIFFLLPFALQVGFFSPLSSFCLSSLAVLFYFSFIWIRNHIYCVFNWPLNLGMLTCYVLLEYSVLYQRIPPPLTCAAKT